MNRRQPSRKVVNYETAMLLELGIIVAFFVMFAGMVLSRTRM